MNTGTIQKTLAALIRKEIAANRLIAYRGDEEFEYLAAWLQYEPPRGEQESPAQNPTQESSLEEMLANCSKCSDIAERKKPFGNGSNRVMIILNAPRLINKIEKDLFRKESVVLLKKMVSAVKLSFNECYITSLIKCESTDVLVTPGQMIKNCGAILKKEIECIQPKLILVMGDILPMQKMINESTSLSWFNIEHPITLLKNPELKRPAWNTLKLVMEKLTE
ncbi:MAG: hypothetical protein GY754_27020 [bacterium]|nr:hypothetical protein [bacterium]